MRTRDVALRRRWTASASLLTGLLLFLVACSGPFGGTTSATALASPTLSATDTPLATTLATLTATLAPAATHTPRPNPTATPRPRPTATPRPRPTATPRPTPTATMPPTPTATNPPPPTPTATPKPKTVVVDIVDFAFSPQSITIHVGDTIEWDNTGSATHTSTSDTGIWNSGDINSGASFSFTFTQAGTYKYHCNIHPFMTGTITVSA